MGLAMGGLSFGCDFGGFAGGVSEDVDQAMGFVRCYRVKAHAVRAEVERFEIAAHLSGNPDSETNRALYTYCDYMVTCPVLTLDLLW